MRDARERAGELEPYADRKRKRFLRQPLDLHTIVEIQQMACAGARPDDILARFMPRGVTMEQIANLLGPPDERAPTGQRRQNRANVGHSKMKMRFGR